MLPFITIDKSIAFYYDFSVDGGVGVFNTRLQPVKNSAVYVILAQSIQDAIAGGVGCDVSIGFASNPTALFNSTNVNNLSSFIFGTNPVTCTGEEIIFTLSNVPFTQGKLKFILKYYEGNV